MNKLNYFPHDYYARNDARLIKLRMNMGCKGIGIYWCIIEMLYEEGGKLKVQDIDTIAYAINEERTNVQQVVQQYDLFCSDDEYFWSEAVLSRLKNIKKISTARAKAGRASAEARRKDKELQTVDTHEDKNSKANGTYVEHLLNKCSTNVQQGVTTKLNNKNKRKIKEKKNNNININSNSRFIPPTLEEVEGYIKEKGYNVNAEQWWNFYASKGWMIGKNKMARWKNAIATWNTKNKEQENGATDKSGATRQYEAGSKAFNRVMSRIINRQSTKTEIDTDDLFSQPPNGGVQE